MKTYTTPNVELYWLDDACDVVTLSYGVDNDNNYGDIEDWGE